MAWRSEQVPDLDGRTMVVTGANSGLGYESARVLARNHADVILACRNEEKGEAAAERIRRESNGARVTVMTLDLANLASVRTFAAKLLESRDAIHGLVNNAGVMAIPRMYTADGFEMQLGTNHIGHFALTGLLIARLLATPGARIVTVSSQAHRMGTMHFHDLDGKARYDKWRAYGQSKLANLLFAFGLAQRLEATRADTLSVACHPGYAATNLQYVGPALEKSRLLELGMRVANALVAQSSRAGALPILYAATSDEVVNGDFIGPRGPAQAWGAPRKVRARRTAYNPELIRRLWEVSVERTGVDFAALDARPVDVRVSAT